MIRARRSINPSHACHSADVLSPTERAVESMPRRSAKPATVKFSQVDQLRESLMSAIPQAIAMADCEEVISSLTSIERDVLELVPIADAWPLDEILKDSCVRGRMVRDRQTMERCLTSLAKQRLIMEVTRGKFRKAKTVASFLTSRIASSPSSEPVASPPENTEAKQTGTSLALRRYVEQLRQEATRLQAMANGIETLAEEIESESSQMGKLGELRALLKQFVD